VTDLGRKRRFYLLYSIARREEGLKFVADQTDTTLRFPSSLLALAGDVRLVFRWRSPRDSAAPHSSAHRRRRFETPPSSLLAHSCRRRSQLFVLASRQLSPLVPRHFFLSTTFYLTSVLICSLAPLCARYFSILFSLHSRLFSLSVFLNRLFLPFLHLISRSHLISSFPSVVFFLVV